MVREAKKLTGSNNLCLAGGVALNCVINGKLLKSGLYDDIWIQSAAGDAGGALGAAYCAYHIYFNKSRETDGKTDKMKGAFLGPRFSDLDIERSMKKFKAVSTYFEDFGKLCEKTADLMNAGNVIGWFQGAIEWGPRALGQQKHHS